MRNDDFMRRAIELARRGEGLVNPNPMVGCVVVKDGKIVTEGWHERIGGFHAERNALTRFTEDVTGAELYVTLEPCCHTGKTPPCTDIIIERGIGKVYVGSDDPNPLVAGKGIRILREAGIEVETHVLKNECDELNEIFFHYITTKTPFVAMKYAMTLDGKIALASERNEVHGEAPGENDAVHGEASGGGILTQSECVKNPVKTRFLVSGPESHLHVHKLRRRYASILVGIGTVLADDPMLDCRLPEAPEGCNPIRIIVDSQLRIPLTSRIVTTADRIPTIVACVESSDSEAEASVDKKKCLIDAGIRVLPIPSGAGDERSRRCVNLEELFRILGGDGIDSVLVEGGSAIHGSLLENPGLIRRVYAYISPKLVGGAAALSPVGGRGITEAAQTLPITDTRIQLLGEDVLITGIPEV